MSDWRLPPEEWREVAARLRAQLEPLDPPKIKPTANAGRLGGHTVRIWLQAGVNAGRLAPGDERIYDAVARHAHGNPRGTFDHGTAGLARATGIPESTVSDAQFRLERYGALYTLRDPRPRRGPIRSASIIGIGADVGHVLAGEPLTATVKQLGRHQRPVLECPAKTDKCAGVRSFKDNGDGDPFDTCRPCRHRLASHRRKRKPWATSPRKAARRQPKDRQPADTYQSDDGDGTTLADTYQSDDGDGTTVEISDADRAAGARQLRIMRGMQDRIRGPT